MNRDQKRRIFQRLKTLSVDKFWEEMNILHTRAYAAAERHYQEAMQIELQPRQAAAVIARAVKIREEWDGMERVTIDDTENSVFISGEGSEENGSKIGATHDGTCVGSKT
jgi:hypothetical protein